MRKSKGFTLLEMMVSMAISLSLLSTLMIFWLALSKSSHQEIVKLGLAQDYAETVSYLRSTLGRIIFSPHCLNVEWLKYRKSEDHPMEKVLFTKSHIQVHHAEDSDALVESFKMVVAEEQYPNFILNNYKLRVLQGSDLIELIYFTPLNVEDYKIVNKEDVKGGQSNYIMVTDCRSYILGEYSRTGDHYNISLDTVNAVVSYLDDSLHLQYYKVNRALVYLSYEQGSHYLIYNFLDGSNYVRFPNVQGMRVEYSSEVNSELIQIQLLMPYLRADNIVDKKFSIRLFGL